jgi:hypothetical protein
MAEISHPLFEREGVTLLATAVAGRLALSGELSGRMEWFAGALASTLPATGRITLDMAEFEVEDGVAMTHLINALRQQLRQGRGVTLDGASQLVAHNLYRIGLLDPASGLLLHNTREDEPYG